MGGHSHTDPQGRRWYDTHLPPLQLQAHAFGTGYDDFHLGDGGVGGGLCKPEGHLHIDWPDDAVHGSHPAAAAHKATGGPGLDVQTEALQVDDLGHAFGDDRARRGRGGGRWIKSREGREVPSDGRNDGQGGEDT